MAQRFVEYASLTDEQFKKKYRYLLFKPTTLSINGETHELQFNFCYNPFCRNYGLPQTRYEAIKNKPYRYKIVGTSGGESTSRIYCNDIEKIKTHGLSIENTSDTVSNWSVAEEIKRLITNNTVIPIEKEYMFHHDGCPQQFTTPFENKKAFSRKGFSTSGSLKYRCNVCHKITNVMPSQKESYTYGQGKSSIMLDFTKDILSRTPVKRTCKKLGIASGTYYNKLEILYRKCLEFLDRHETKPLMDKQFGDLYLNTDMMIYYLNNVRQKGKGGKKDPIQPDKKYPTYLIASGDLKTGYVFRSDIAYDYNVSLDTIDEDTKLFHCDHSYSFLRKYERLRYPYSPQPPTDFDSQSTAEYIQEKAEFQNRKNYVEGCHVKSTYTTMAHYWLIKQQIRADNLFFVSDDDSTLQASIFRVFCDEIRNRTARYFTCTCDKSLSLEQAGELSLVQRRDLRDWAKSLGIKEKYLTNIAKLKLIYDLRSHDFYEYKTVNGNHYPIRSVNPITAPLADKDEGIRYLNCLTDITDMTEEELADILIKINSRTINNFFNELRRSVSVLERPLVTARGEGKSYIYSNYNPKYAQYLTTIFRTMYNFCSPKKYGGVWRTPAQQLGLTDKVFDYKDIIYFV